MYVILDSDTVMLLFRPADIFIQMNLGIGALSEINSPVVISSRIIPSYLNPSL